MVELSSDKKSTTLSLKNALSARAVFLCVTQLLTSKSIAG